MSRLMRAAILEGVGRPLRIADDVEIDDPRAGEVLVRITHCGVCNTDLALADGKVGYPCSGAGSRSSGHGRGTWCGGN